MKPTFGEHIYFADGLRGFPPNFIMLKVFCWQKGTNQFLFVVLFLDGHFLAEYDCHTEIRDSGEFQDGAIVPWAPYGNPMVNLFDRPH